MNNYLSFIILTFKRNNKVLTVFAVFFLLNIIQAIFTPLLNDESYYWNYAQNIDWGYFDHPPLIAYIIRLSSQFLPGVIGVRLFSVILGSFTCYYLFRIINKEANSEISFELIFLLMGSSFFLNLYSFLAIPDTPLLFFGVMFFWYYQKFLENDSWQNILALGIVIPLLLYSKYHGILIIVFTVLANPLILKKKSFYIILFIALALFLPHIYWLTKNDFRTIRFQLIERGFLKFEIKHVFSYIGEQLGLTGPIYLLLFSILYKPKNLFQKTLKYNVIGVFVFFFLNSFKRSVIYHWTDITWIPMLSLTYLYITQKKLNKRLINVLLLLNLFIVVVMRLDLLFGWFVIPPYWDKNPKLLTETLKKETNNEPLVFVNMYIEPSLCMFYQKQKSFAINTLGYKRTQFNYWNKYEKELQGEKVNLISYSKQNDSSKQVTIKDGRTYFINTITDFRSFFTTVEVVALNLKNKINAGREFTIQYIVKNELKANEKELINIKDFHVVLTMSNSITEEDYRFYDMLNIFKTDISEFQIMVPEIRGKYRCIFSICSDYYPYLNGFNSKSYFIEIE